MKVFIDRLNETPTPVAFEVDRAWLATMLGDQWPTGDLAGPLRLSGQAHMVGEDLFIEGLAEGDTDLECGRCLERYRQGLREGFQLVLEPARDRIPTDPEGVLALSRDGVCLGDELEAGWYQGKQIDLGAIFVEVVWLALAATPMCREDCVGLCQHCGVNLSTARCTCEETRKDSPFAVLASLREGMEKE
jgi:uncharacterized protein